MLKQSTVFLPRTHSRMSHHTVRICKGGTLMSLSSVCTHHMSRVPKVLYKQNITQWAWKLRQKTCHESEDSLACVLSLVLAWGTVK